MASSSSSGASAAARFRSLELDGGRYATPYRFIRALRRRPLTLPASAAPQAVQLMTIHGAKGREWPVVLVVRVNEDILPLCLGAADEGGGASAECVAEERRLLYVAMTRAREQLLLSYVMMGEDKVPSSAS